MVEEFDILAGDDEGAEVELAKIRSGISEKHYNINKCWVHGFYQIGYWVILDFTIKTKLTKKYIRSKVGREKIKGIAYERFANINGNIYKADDITGCVYRDEIKLKFTGWDKEDFVDNLYDYINN